MPEPIPVPLAVGETLRWQGSPDPRKIFMPSDVFLVPFYGLFMAVAIFVSVGAATTTPPTFLVAFMSVFIVVGAYATVGRFLVKTIRKKRTIYAVTDRRAIIQTPWSTREVRLNAAGIELTTTGSGRHLTAIFSDPTVGHRSGSLLTQRWANEQFRNSGMEMLAGSQHSPAFYDVADVDGLRAALEPFLHQAPTPSTPPPYGT
jgi:hypothetical protein